jgi:hypothetical protein
MGDIVDRKRRAVLWYSHHSDAERRAHAACTHSPLYHNCVRTIIGRHVAIHLRPAALKALARRVLPDDVVGRITEFWWQGHMFTVSTGTSRVNIPNAR